MNEDIRYLLATVCVFPAAIGIYKYKRVNSSFHPFIYMMLLDVIVETIIYIYIKFPQLGHKQFIAVNIYMLLNFFLFLSLVTSYNYLNKKGAVVLFVIAVIFGTGNFIYSKTALDPFYYLLCFVSLVMLFISINILSKQIMAVKQQLFDNFWFWMSGTSVLYNAYTLLIFVFYFFALSDTPHGKAIGNIQTYVSAGCYIFFGIALLKIPVTLKAIKNRWPGDK